MSQAWIETYTGIRFDMLEPTTEMINIEDVAHALSQMNRFTGHCRFPYPVSQHSRLGSYLVPEEDALWFLLHDASEAYLGDMNSPLKHFTPAGVEYCKAEKVVQDMIYSRFGLIGSEPASVHTMDMAMLYAEKNQLMSGLTWDTKWDETEQAADVKIYETPFLGNKTLFLNRFFELYKGDV